MCIAGSRIRYSKVRYIGSYKGGKQGTSLVGFTLYGPFQRLQAPVGHRTIRWGLRTRRASSKCLGVAWYLSMYVSMFMCLSIHLSIHPSICLTTSADHNYRTPKSMSFSRNAYSTSTVALPWQKFMPLF